MVGVLFESVLGGWWAVFGGLVDFWCVCGFYRGFMHHLLCESLSIGRRSPAFIVIEIEYERFRGLNAFVNVFCGLIS